MKKQQKAKKSGFTIIEVVLVLAIAALIFLIVFLAVPALQKNQRDTQRRSDMARFISQLQTYAGNHNGTVPTAGSVGTFVTKYMANGSGNFVSPSGNNYTVTGYTSLASGTTPDVDAISYFVSSGGGSGGFTCDASGSIAASSNARSVAVITTLEGSNDQYCLSNFSS